MGKGTVGETTCLTSHPPTGFCLKYQPGCNRRNASACVQGAPGGWRPACFWSAEEMAPCCGGWRCPMRPKATTRLLSIAGAATSTSFCLARAGRLMAALCGRYRSRASTRQTSTRSTDGLLRRRSIIYNLTTLTTFHAH